ncbi:MAG TPA: ABC transporter substrate-binding protein [Xanthobacteraceae bacterium]|nr:ABC transporter substrate-binding protein [Xanthobacteraceae bacterium]
MTIAWGSRANPAAKADKVDKQRRKLLKLAAAGGAGVMTSPWTFQSSRAAPKTIKIGQITPETGPIAAFGEPSKWVAEEVTKFLGGHLEVAGEKHPIQILNRDSQSNPNRASDVAADLINNDKVDIMIASSTGDTTNPVADQCELAGVPCITSDDPWQSWFFGRKGDPKKGFEWTYHFFWGFDMVANMFAEMWLTLPTNKIAGVMLTNDPDGIAASNPEHGLPATIKSHGFDVHYLGLYPPLSDDFSAQIGQLKSMNADIACGIFNPPQFAIFWTQCAQQGFKPMIVTPPKALLFPTAVEALGDRGAGMSTEVWWSHHHPFKSGLTGQTAQQFCDAYEKASGKQWTQPLGFKHANLEVAIDALKRAKKLNAASIRDAIAETDYHSIVGPITWKAGPGPLNPVPNVCTTPIVGGQWEKGTKWKYDLNIVFNGSAPQIPTDRPFSAISYS